MTETSPALLLSVVVPCLNEQDMLAELVRRVARICHSVVGSGSFEIVLVNDGSTDGTLALMHKLADEHPFLVIVNLSRRHGHQIALTAGLSIAQGQRVLILDADLQDPPEILPAMMQALDAGADVAFGVREERLGENWFKRASASFFYRFFEKLAEVPTPRDTGDFRLMSRRAVDLLNAMPERSRFLRGMVSWIGLTQVPIPYTRAARVQGTSKYPLFKMLGFAVEALTSFSILPLRIASYAGGLMGFAALALLAYVFHAWLAGETVQGWTSLMVVVLVIGSAQLVCLGIFGEYLGRLYMESKRRPLFVVESIRRSSPKP